MIDEMAIVKKYAAHLPVEVNALIRELGLTYFEAPMPSENSGRIHKDGSDFTITVNASEGPQRRRFTAAHELGHYLLHRDLLPDGAHLDRLFNAQGYEEANDGIRPHHEVQANQFAANLLMPATFLRTHYDPAADNYKELARNCAVSSRAMQVRLKALGLRG
ncbi:ImmA/IrrE family metallo-endopeptidase [Paracoccus cavernae]|uniref:ImmA/IrrE family metallo-endopeptidase n=1 Tax=Paracoccus cavernae TaxID=1571207 RepID=A0ABT8D2M2_9RHOB|nr:ImmA/IrrE family metallo-endopeptidase [Paracoccus cavernae]